MDTFTTTLRKLMEAQGFNQKSLAKAAGLNDTAVRDILVGKSGDPRVSTIVALANVLGPDFLQAALGYAAEPQPKPPNDLFALVPVYDARAAAGTGAINHDQPPVCFSAFRWDWLHRVTSATPEQLAVIQVAGDSMEPTLHHGDHVLIDRTISRWTRDGLYVIRYAISDELMVKRLIWVPSARSFTIRSDNVAYGATDGVEPADIAVIGRVLWLGRNVG
jgi:phage repressor protein C with HTH and peptisase S24 domain